ncbi:MAG: DNA primase [Clostridiales bacterium]|nr:DNA primase [Candidatus Crickella equi]
MAWDNSFIDELKMQVNIVDVVGRVVDLKKSGANYKGLCPFHSEKTPSFMVNEEKQIFNCFGCGEKGDVIKFVESYHKIPFIEAVDQLCDEYGIKKPERASSGPKIDYDHYYAINAKAARFFYNALGTKNNRGLAYFKKRGLSKETITKWGLGYAPATGTALVDYLHSENVSDADMLKLGLANEGKNGLYDKYRDRCIFPIMNTQGKVIGFGGRAIEDIKPKYINSSESEIFLKKNNLFGLNFTKKDISDEDRAIVVEGYMDVISLYQAGVQNVVASLGTALTDNQAKLLTRYSKNVVLSYDSDGAGIKAALRGIEVMAGAGAKTKVLSVIDGKDPDDYVKAHGKDGFNELVDNAVPATQFRLDLARKGFNFNNDMEVLEYIERIVPVLKSIGPVEQDLYIKRLSNEFGVSEHAITMAVRSESDGTQKGAIVNRRPSRSSDVGDRDMHIEMSLLILAMKNSRYLKRFGEDNIEFRSPLAKKILSALESLATNRKPGADGIDENDIFRALDPDEEKVFAKYVNTTKLGPDDEVYYKETRASYKVNSLKDERVEVMNSLAVAEQMNQTDEMDKLAARLIEIDNLIKNTMEG